MRFLIRGVAVLAAISVLMTLWFIAAFSGAGLGPLLRSGLLGGLTIAGWIVTLVLGPIAVVQLWRFREMGRGAAIVLFGYGLMYYLVGLVALRAPGASIKQIAAAATMYGVPLLVLLSPAARPLFEAKGSNAGLTPRNDGIVEP